MVPVDSKQTLVSFSSVSPNTPLYHYTDQSGFLGIIKNKEIWATHTQHLNDRQEYIHARDLAAEELEGLIKKTTDPRESAILAAMKDDLGSGVEQVNVCVCSFSEEPDSLAQWRAYGGETSGFSIGFAPDFLASVTADTDFVLAKCIYNPEQQLQLITALLQTVIAETRAKMPPTGLPNWLATNIHSYLNQYAPLIKHPKFSEEREWRLTSTPLSCTHERFDFRPGRSMITPYYRIPLFSASVPFAVHEVVVGPTPHQERSLRAVNNFLVSEDIWPAPPGVKDTQTTLRASEVPFRSW